MEPMVEIPREKWPELRGLYRTDLSDEVPAVCLLDSQIAQPLLAEPFAFKIYCPEGELTNGFIATSLLQDFYQVVIQPVGKNISKIEESLITTKIIDWERGVVIPSANKTTIECLERIKEQMGLKIIYGNGTKAEKHFLDKNTEKFNDIVLPPNTYIGPLRSEHINTVAKTWIYYSPSTYHLYEIFIKNDLSYVLYSNDANKADEEGIEEQNNENVSGEPVAWVSVNDHGALTHLFCVEHKRNKGYATLITKYAVNKMLSNGLNVLAYTHENNESSKKLLRKIGFKDFGYDYWVIVDKIK